MGGDVRFEDIHAVKLPRQTHGYRGINGDFIRLKDGTILWAYSSDTEDIVAIRSADEGRTWSKAELLIPKPAPPASGRIVHPSFLRLPTGTIMISYIYSTHPVTPYYGHNYTRLSADEGATWTDPTIMTPYPGYVIIHNDRLHILSSGRILAIAEYKAYMPSSQDHSGYVGMSFFSDNNGVSWQNSRNTVDMYPVEVQEADAVELKDGRIMMVGRTYSGYPVKAYSEDGGETWSKGERMPGISMPYAGLPSIRRIPSTGDLLFIWISEKSNDSKNPKIQRRCALTAAISQDEGQTFEHRRHIARDPEDDFGYQCVLFLDNDRCLVGYHTRDGLHVARIDVGWFYGQ